MPAAGEKFCPPQAKKFSGFLTYFTYFCLCITLYHTLSTHQRASSTPFSPLYSENLALLVSEPLLHTPLHGLISTQ